MSGKKEYTLKINGVDVSIKEVTRLEEAVTALDTSIDKVNDANVAQTRTTKEKVSALSEEEKLTKKLEDTQKRIKAAQEGATDAQVRSTQELREATREQARRVQIEQLAEGSVKRLGMELTDLRNAYQGLSSDERENVEVGGAMLEKIQSMDSEYKALKESTGQFQDSVGNYEKGLGGLGKMSEGIEGITKSSMGMAQGLMGGLALMSLFGNQSEEDAASAQQLQKVIALLSIAQQVNTNILREGIVQNKLAVVTDTIRATQIKAKAAAEVAATKGTVAATVAQKIFNVVAAMNPYVLLAMALIAVGAALFAFISNTDDAAEKQEKLNKEQEAYLDKLDREEAAVRSVSKERVAALERQLKVLGAEGGKLEETRALEDKIMAERRRASAELLKGREAELASLAKNQWKLEQYKDALERFTKAQREGVEGVKWNAEIDGSFNFSEYDIEDAISLAQEKIDLYGRGVEVSVGLNTEKLDLDAEEATLKAKRKREDDEAAKKGADAAKSRASAELAALRASEDARVKLIADSHERSRQTINNAYDRQTKDMRTRIDTDTNLTVAAKAAMGEHIAHLEKQRTADLEALEKERAKKALELQQEVEDSRIAIMAGNYDRQEAEVNAQYDRQIAAYKARLAEDTTLTEQQQAQITELITNAEEQRGAEIGAIKKNQLDEQAALLLTATEDALARVENKIGEVVVRGKTGLQLIDVEATQKNLATANQALGDYVGGLQTYLAALRAAHEQTLAGLKEGTPEYEAALLDYARTVEDVTQRIKVAQDEQADNAKKSSQVQVEALQETFGKIADYASMAAEAITMLTDTLNMSLQAQLDELNTQLDVLDERYEEAQKQREDAAKNVEDIEAQMREATGGTAEALKAQLQDAQQARDEAAREEKRAAKEKEAMEKEIARKEKQMKRNDLIAKIVMGIANTAVGVTQALGSAPPPLNFIMAGLVGAFGLVQTGIMSAQLAKLADGGEIVGPSHANGGVPIAGTNYEVEGGEFVVNKRSYSANAGLVKFINGTPRPVTAFDLMGVMPSAAAPTGAPDMPPDSSAILDAIRRINFSPVVSVQDINDVNDEVTTVKDLAGF